jgi:hypothetical protein
MPRPPSPRLSARDGDAVGVFPRLLARVGDAASDASGVDTPDWPEAEQHQAEARVSAIEQARRSLGEDSNVMKSLFG